MKLKRIISALLAVGMLIGQGLMPAADIFSVTASAEEVIYKRASSKSYKSMYDTQVSLSADGRYKAVVIIYGSVSCGYTSATMTSFAKSGWAVKDSVKIIMVDVAGTGNKETLEYARTKSLKFNYCCDEDSFGAASDALYDMFFYARQIGYTDRLSYPIIVVSDENDNVRHIVHPAKDSMYNGTVASEILAEINKFTDLDAPLPPKPPISGTISFSGYYGKVTADISSLDITDAYGKTQSAYVSDGSFSLSSLADGAYTLTARKPLYCPRGYSVSISDGQLSGGLDIELIRYGDIDKTGEVNITDALQIVNYRNSKSSSFDKAGGDDLDYLKNVADINGDGTVNIADALQIVNYRNGKASAFDDIP